MSLICHYLVVTTREFLGRKVFTHRPWCYSTDAICWFHLGNGKTDNRCIALTCGSNSTQLNSFCIANVNVNRIMCILKSVPHTKNHSNGTLSLSCYAHIKGRSKNYRGVSLIKMVIKTYLVLWRGKTCTHINKYLAIRMRRKNAALHNGPYEGKFFFSPRLRWAILWMEIPDFFWSCGYCLL